MSNDVEIVVRSRDQSAAGIESATNRIRTLKAEAASVRDVRITVDVDSGAAEAQLGAVRAEEGALDGKTANVNVDADVGAALAKIALVGAALAGISAGVAGIGMAAGIGAVAAGGLGAVIGGLSGVGAAVSAMGQKTAAAGGAAMSTAKAVRGANEQVIQAHEGVTRAEHELEAAHRGVENAQHDLTRADREAKDAQDQLNDARREAKRDLEDLNDAVAQSALDQRAASLDVQKAKEELDAVTSNTFATEEQRKATQLAYDEAVQHQTRLQHEGRQLQEDQATAAKKGVEGADKVKSAQERVEDALYRVAQAHQGVADAQDKVTEATVRLGDAQRQLAIAQQSAAEAGQKAASGGAGGVNALAAAMANLSPAGQKFARFMYGFINGPIKELRFAAQDGLLPPLQAALEKLGPVIHKLAPAFQQFSGAIGKALGGAVTLVGQLAPSFLKFATAALQGLAPLGPVMQQFAVSFGAMVDRVTKDGSLKGAMDGLVQIVAAIVDNLPAIIEVGLELGKALGPALADAVRQLLPLILEIAKALGPLLVAALEALAPAIQDITTWIAEHQGVFQALLVVLGLIALAVWAITSPVSAIILAFVILAAALVVLYQRSATFRAIVEAIRASILRTWDTLKGWVAWISTNFPKAYHAIVNAIGGAVDSVRNKWNGLIAFFRSIPGRISSTAKGMWNGVKNAAGAAVQWVQDKFNGLIGFVQGIPGRITGAVGGALSSLGGMIPGFAAGGISHAAGGGPRSNLVQVGEHGRELVRLPFGSSVIPNGQTESMLGGSGGGRVVLEIHSGGTRLDDTLLEILRGAIRVKGGNVQTVLGR